MVELRNGLVIEFRNLSHEFGTTALRVPVAISLVPVALVIQFDD